MSKLTKVTQIILWFFPESDAPPSTLKKALTSYFDLGSPLTPDRMEDWVEFATDEKEKEAILKVHPCLCLRILNINFPFRFTRTFYNYRFLQIQFTSAFLWLQVSTLLSLW